MDLDELSGKIVDYYPTLLVDGRHGQYVPQVFAEQIDNRAWGLEDFDPDYQTILKGPEEEFYWESWDAVLNKASYIHPETQEKYILSEEDGDVFMISIGRLNRKFDSSNSTVYFY